MSEPQLTHLNSLINKRLQANLPGWEAQKLMSPFTQQGIPLRKQNGNEKPSAVLVLLTEALNGLEIVYTVRHKKLKNHSGQISFPGGRLDPGETIEQAALREAWEEINLDQDQPELLGTLSPLPVPHSQSLVTPVVAYLDHLPEFRPNEDEVDEIFTTPLDKLLHPETRKETRRNLAGLEYIIPYYDVHDTPLWGATAMMTSELLSIIRDSL